MSRFNKKEKKKKERKTVDNKEISNDIFQGKISALSLYKYIHKKTNKNKFKINVLS